MAGAKRKNLLRAIEELKWDLWLAVTTIGLVIFGVVMVYSSSAAAKSPHRFLFSQIAWASLGLMVMAIVRKIDYHDYAQPRFIFWFLGICFVLLMVVFFFPPINGAHRWISFKGLSAQPSELSKLALVIFLAWFCPSAGVMTSSIALD